MGEEFDLCVWWRMGAWGTHVLLSEELRTEINRLTAKSWHLGRMVLQYMAYSCGAGHLTDT